MNLKYEPASEPARIVEVTRRRGRLIAGLCGANPARVGYPPSVEREFFIDNLLVRVHFIIVMIRWTGLAP